MSVILLLLLFVIWMAQSPQEAGRAVAPGGWGPAIFLAGYGILIFAVGWRERWLVRRVAIQGMMARLRRSGRIITFAQILILAWFWVGVFYLGWGSAVAILLGPVAHWNLESPGLVIGVLPGLLAWTGLWWAHFPVDRTLREQNLLFQLDADLPLHAPPTFGEYFISKLRMQLLFTAVPVLMIIAVRDLAGLVLDRLGWITSPATADAVVSGGSAVLVFVIAPEILRRVLATEPLPDTPLRTRLSEVANRDGVRCRDVLLWRTHHTVGNAAVMGLVRWFRYVLLSDLLLETLHDDEVLAVFAHEVGHIIHRHMIWYGIFLIGLAMAFVGIGDVVTVGASSIGVSQSVVDQILPIVSILTFVICFGFLSRRFERQADVHAARTMQAIGDGARAKQSHVGPHGAMVFNAALMRVSEVNNIPTEAQGRFAGTLRQRAAFFVEWSGTMAASWLHGTMASRMRYISSISRDPGLTRQFDRQMVRLRVALVVLFLGCGLWAGTEMRREDSGAGETARVENQKVVAAEGLGMPGGVN